MEKEQTIQTEKMSGDSGCVNKNCWLARNLNYPPAKRCQYCELKFSDCLFERYLLISLILASCLLLVGYLVEKNISKSLIVSIFVLIITYGYFFNKSTEKIIVSNFEEKKAKNAFKELSMTLQQKVAKATAELQAGKSKVEKAYEVEKQAREELQKLNQAKSEFLNIASHQLRTPISVIKGITSMMIEGDLEKISPEKKQIFIRGIWEKSQKLESIINDILNAAEMTNQEYTAKTKKDDHFDLLALLKEIIEGFQPLVKEREIDLSLESPDESILISGEKEYLREALSNLIDNAIKYTPSTGVNRESRDKRSERGKIIVTMKKDSKNVIIEITDNGMGIPANEIPGLFKKFSRASNARNMYTDGSGLGLFIVKEIIEGHGGRISLTSEIDKGTTFHVKLPLRGSGETDIKKYIIDKQQV